MAGTDDQSVLFYNPAAVRLVKGTGITASTSFIYYQWLRMQGLGGLGLDGTDGSSDNSPRLVAGAFDAGERWRISIGFVSAQYSDFEMDAATAVAADAAPGSEGPAVVRGLAHHSNVLRDDQMGLGASYLLNDRSAVGITLFGSSFIQRFNYSDRLTVYNETATSIDLATVERGEVENLGFVVKLGYLRHGDGVQWGAALALPRLSTALWEGSMYRSNNGISPGGTINTLHYSEELGTQYRTPWIIDAGMQIKRSSALWAFRLCYAAAVDPYDRMILTRADEVSLSPSGDTEPVLRVRSASHAVLNGSVGALFRLSEKADLLAGFRTDLNHLDRSALETGADLSGTFSYWDLYHASCGVDLHSDRVKLTAGLVYAFGQATGVPERLLTFPEHTSVSMMQPPMKTTYQQIGFTFGFSYFVLRPVDGSKPTDRS